MYAIRSYYGVFTVAHGLGLLELQGEGAREVAHLAADPGAQVVGDGAVALGVPGPRPGPAEAEAAMRRPSAKPIRDAVREAQMFRTRALTGVLVILVCFLVLAGRSFDLQVRRHDEFITRSEANRFIV